MKRNEYRHGAPEGLWARAARSPRGEIGVSFGFGEALISFVREQDLPVFLARNAGHTGDEATILSLVKAAAADLPAFRAKLRAVKAASVN